MAACWSREQPQQRHHHYSLAKAVPLHRPTCNTPTQGRPRPRPTRGCSTAPAAEGGRPAAVVTMPWSWLFASAPCLPRKSRPEHKSVARSSMGNTWSLPRPALRAGTCGRNKVRNCRRWWRNGREEIHSQDQLTILPPPHPTPKGSSNEYAFDVAFDADASQSEVYEHTAKLHVPSVLDGYNVSILAYGATGAGT